MFNLNVTFKLFCVLFRSILKAIILYFMLFGVSRDASLAERHMKQARNTLKSFLEAQTRCALFHGFVCLLVS